MSGIESGNEVDVREAVLLHENGKYMELMWLDGGNVVPVWSGESVCHEISLPLDISYIRRHFRHA